MKVNITISDDLYEEYVKKFGVPGCFAQMTRAITVFKDVDKSDRYVFLAGDARRAVEAVFQTTIESGEDLAKKLATLNRFKIGGVDIAFDVGELQRIDSQAGFHSRSRDQFIREMAEEIKNLMLDKI